MVADSTTPDELLDAFAAKLVETLEAEAPMHRLWYDLRTQSMFDETAARGGADDRPHPGGHDLAGDLPLRRAQRCGGRDVPAAAYGVLDGLFQQALLGYLTGDEQAALDTLVGQVHALMPLTLAPFSS